MKNILTLVILLWATNLFGQVEVVGHGRTDNINSMLFINDSLGFFTADRGVLMKSTDAGKTWQKDVFPDSNDIMDLEMISDRTLFASSGATLYKSTDTGHSWTLVHHDACDTIVSLYVFDDYYAFGIIKKNYSGIENKVIADTRDSLEYWGDVKITYFYLTIKPSEYMDIDFLERDTLYISSHIGIMRFLANNNSTHYHDDIQYTTEDKIKDLSLTKDRHLFGICDSNFLYHFSNITAKYEEDVVSGRRQLYSFQNLNGLHFISQDTGIVYGDSGTIMRTYDGGDTWVNLNYKTDKNLTGHYVKDKKTLFVFGKERP